MENPLKIRQVPKNRLKEEGSQLVTNCNQLKMRSPKDGKRYNDTKEEESDAGTT